MELVRKLNKKGIEVFSVYLDGVNAGVKELPPNSILYDNMFSSPLSFKTEIERRDFNTRLDAAVYFSKVFSTQKANQISIDVGLWSWLSLFYFDQVCPAEKSGTRYPGRRYRHILEVGYPYGHRHLLGGAYLVYVVYELGEDLCKLLLKTPLYRENAFHHEFTSRMNFIMNKSIMEAVSLLYLDNKSEYPKRSSMSRKALGNLHRFIDVMQQFELTYDLFNLSGKQILKLLPNEFDHWKH